MRVFEINPKGVSYVEHHPFKTKKHRNQMIGDLSTGYPFDGVPH